MYYVYIMTNKRKNVLYTGVTSNIVGRVWQHKNKALPGFTSKYRVCCLVYYEEYQYVYDAIAREKQIKNWKRKWKEDLIRKLNPGWKDLASEWYDRDAESDPVIRRDFGSA
ncbi:MAG: GIY-YIG nuclease family protein [Patescibacteria group bacterium]